MQQDQNQVRLAAPEDIQKFGEGAQVQTYHPVQFSQSCWLVGAIGITEDGLFYVESAWTAMRKPVTMSGNSMPQWVRCPDEPAYAFEMTQLEVVSEAEGLLEMFDHDGLQFLTMLAPGHDAFIPEGKLFPAEYHPLPERLGIKRPAKKPVPHERAGALRTYLF